MVFLRDIRNRSIRFYCVSQTDDVIPEQNRLDESLPANQACNMKNSYYEKQTVEFNSESLNRICKSFCMRSFCPKVIIFVQREDGFPGHVFCILRKGGKIGLENGPALTTL